jgi:hypothetical protein
MMLRHWAADHFPWGLRAHGAGWATAEEISCALWQNFGSHIAADDVLKLVMASTQVWHDRPERLVQSSPAVPSLETNRFEVRVSETTASDNPNDEVFIFCHPSKRVLRRADCHRARGDAPWRRTLRKSQEAKAEAAGDEADAKAEADDADEEIWDEEE